MKVSELTLQQLDSWVARAEETPFVMRNGFPCREDEFDPEIHCHESSTKEWKCWTRLQYSSDWGYGGPIIEREQETIDGCGADGLWRTAEAWKCQLKRQGYVCEGATPLEAAMRCYVSSKYGDEVSEGQA